MCRNILQKIFQDFWSFILTLQENVLTSALAVTNPENHMPSQCFCKKEMFLQNLWLLITPCNINGIEPAWNSPFVHSLFLEHNMNINKISFELYTQSSNERQPMSLNDHQQYVSLHNFAFFAVLLQLYCTWMPAAMELHSCQKHHMTLKTIKLHYLDKQCPFLTETFTNTSTHPKTWKKGSFIHYHWRVYTAWAQKAEISQPNWRIRCWETKL